jgi:hypothetical protein
VFAQNQQVPAGLQVTLDVLQSFTAGDNLSRVTTPSGNGFVARTDLTFGILSETRGQSLELEVGARLEAGDLPDEGGNVSDVVNPFAVLAYTREAANSRLSVDAFSRETQLRDAVLTVIDLDTLEISDLVIDGGTRTNRRVALGFVHGEGGPVVTDLGLTWNNTAYDSTNATLEDRERLQFDGSLRLAVTRNTDLLLAVDAIREDRETAGDLELDTTRFWAGVIADVTDATRLDLRIGNSRIETTETVGTVRSTLSETAPVARLTLTHDLPNGTVSARFNSNHSRAGTRQTLRFRRDMDLPTGQIGLSVGATRGSGSDIKPLVELDYRQDFARATLLATVSQTGSANSVGEEYLNSRANLRYVHELSRLMQLDLNLRLTDVEQISAAGGGDRQRTTASLAVNYDLTEDWTLSTGYRHEEQVSNGVTTLRGNEIFANFQRSFDLRP